VKLAAPGPAAVPMTPAGKIEPQEWMTAPETRAVLAALADDGAELRFVGGCVRDAVLGRPVQDVDLATPAPPERVLALLERAGPDVALQVLVVPVLGPRVGPAVEVFVRGVVGGDLVGRRLDHLQALEPADGLRARDGLPAPERRAVGRDLAAVGDQPVRDDAHHVDLLAVGVADGVAVGVKQGRALRVARPSVLP